MPFLGCCCSYRGRCSAARAHDVLLLYVVRAWALMCMWVTARLSVRRSLPFLFLCCGYVGAVGSLSNAVGISRYLSSLSAVS